MGDFRIVVEGLGGHGVQRDKGDGATIDFAVEGVHTADAMGAELVTLLRSYGVQVKVARIEHWPADLGYSEPGPVDDLLTGKRQGDWPKPEQPFTLSQSQAT